MTDNGDNDRAICLAGLFLSCKMEVQMKARRRAANASLLMRCGLDDSWFATIEKTQCTVLYI
jgi:hypothetical protein